MELPLRPRAIDELQAASAVGQGKLYQVYDELLRARGVPTAQVLLTFFDMSARTHYLNARQTLRKLLEWRVVPVINENDTTTTDEISFGNNDFLAAQVAILLGAELLVLLTDAEGVFTADPRTDPSARLVTEVAAFDELDGLDIGHATSPLGSGGMRSKVVAAEMATAAGIPTVIAERAAPGALLRGRAGEPVGTRFAARAGRYSSFKLWLQVRQAGARAGARRRRRGARAARGRHEPAAGRDRRGVGRVRRRRRGRDRPRRGAVGKGICNYSAEELRRVPGLKSAEVRELTARAPARRPSTGTISCSRNLCRAGPWPPSPRHP